MSCPWKLKRKAEAGINFQMFPFILTPPVLVTIQTLIQILFMFLWVKLQCDNVLCQQVVRCLFWPKKKEKGSTAWGLWGSFLTFSQETNSSFGVRDFDADCSLWRMSSLITSEIHLHLPPPQNLPPVWTSCVCQLKSCPWLLYVPQIKLPAVCESAGWVVFYLNCNAVISLAC